MSRARVLVFLFAAIVFAAVVVIAPVQRARAGARELDVLFIRVDDNSDPAADACVGTVRRELERRSDGPIRSMAPSVAASRLGAASLADFMTFPAERLFEIIEDAQSPTDALVILDCRPQLEALDAVVLAGSGSLAHRVVQRIQLRHVRVETTGARAVATILGHWQWTNFSP